MTNPKFNIEMLRALTAPELKKLIRNENNKHFHKVLPDLTHKNEADLICIYRELWHNSNI